MWRARAVHAYMRLLSCNAGSGRTMGSRSRPTRRWCRTWRRTCSASGSAGRTSSRARRWRSAGSSCSGSRGRRRSPGRGAGGAKAREAHSQGRHCQEEPLQHYTYTAAVVSIAAQACEFCCLNTCEGHELPEEDLCNSVIFDATARRQRPLAQHGMYTQSCVLIANQSQCCRY